MPDVSWATTSFFRSMIRRKSIVGAETWNPHVSQSVIVSAISALRQRHFVGIQPSWRQVPPAFRCSNKVTLSPFFAAYTAVS